MSCEHYWREGVRLVERGEADPHREDCQVCRREHAMRERITRALSLVGSDAAGDQAWQAEVWRRIARLEAPRSKPWRWWGGAVAFCAILLFWRMSDWRQAPPQELPMIEILPAEKMRSTSLGSPMPGDRVRLSVQAGQEARIYRAGLLLLRCPSGQGRPGCSLDGRGVVAEALLAVSGRYQLVVISGPGGHASGVLARDLEAVAAAGGRYNYRELLVR